MSDGENDSLDIISSLPDSIKESILMCLPLLEAVRTSALSRNWRYTWTRIPHVNLDLSLWPGSMDCKDLKGLTYLRRIINVLLSHEGPITTFSFYIAPIMQLCPEIDKILCMVLKHNDIENLKLYNCIGQPHKLPSCFFRLQKLKYVELHSCSIRPPSGFIGFNQLVTLTMRWVTIGSEQLVALVSSCPLLENLSLFNSYAYEALEIEAPKLKRFRLGSKIKHLSFKNSPLLEELQLAVDDISLRHGMEDGEILSLKRFNFFELLSSLPELRVLRFLCHYMESIFAGGIFTRPKLTLVHLHTLELEEICLDTCVGISCLLCLIRLSPNLRQIIMFLTTGGSRSAMTTLTFKLMEVEEHSDIKLDQLRVVDLTGFAGTKNQMEFVKFLLFKSPQLRKMRLQCYGTSLEEIYKTVQELIRFGRASPSAEIIYVP